ncbi:MAG: MerR family transcriptional regulator [Xanthomonadales bacterium]|nr:MerR family transcriptional regulator [Gammaproteobacteria bacterium]MBT8052950.1 MerR family transcriptional regulator [Gammaproteobacteria bacterium]NND57842.1 MerR family transcriptional regulator [Xanthomonadales bacterium]NNK50721.1 MerR family transcriptional regulator [Xanthomonadales bacterium]
MNAEAKILDYPSEKLYTIGTVSKLTGVGAITLRAWERRYGLIKPVRKESGHRLYTRQHIDQINRITSLTQQGIRISQISPEMLESESPLDQGGESDAWNEYLNSMMAAIISFDEQRLEEVYNNALSLYPIGMVTRKLLTPLLIELGLRWAEGGGGIAEEHFFAFYLRNKLGARYHHRPRSDNGARILLAGLPGENHDVGLLLFALAAHEAGYRVIPLGANMPLHELEVVAKSKNCSAIVLAGAIEPTERTLAKELPALVKQSGVPVTVGGLASVYGCEAIDRAGAKPLGRDIERGLEKLNEVLSSKRND